MLKMYPSTKRWALIAAVCVSACVITGCIESSFNLATESRLPPGVSIPPGLTRADVTVTLDYIGISQARFTLRDKNGKRLTRAYGKTRGNPIYLRAKLNGPDTTGTGYQIVAINGVTEIVGHSTYREHENMVQNGQRGSLFYVVDDPAVKRQVLAAGERTR